MRNIIFDFGNVLVRWEPQRVFLPYFGSEERFRFFWDKVCDADFRNRIDAGESQAGCIAERQRLFPDYAEAIAMYYTTWEEALPGEMPGMFDLVTRLKGEPETRIYGLTNWSMETFPKARQRFGVLRLIDDYVVSGDAGMVKPNPAIFRLLLDRFGLRAEECIFIDDNPANVEAASGLGLRGILFRDASQLEETIRALPVGGTKIEMGRDTDCR